jgi:hypothetical protein
MFPVFRNVVAKGEVVNLDTSKKNANSNSEDKGITIEVLFPYFHRLVSSNFNYNILIFIKNWYR